MVQFLDGDKHGFEFERKAAGISKTKSKSALIDSGVSHHFFHSRKSFVEYVRIPSKNVKTASRVSNLVGKGQVWTSVLRDVY